MLSSGTRAETSRSAVVRQLRALGVRADGVLLVHTSFRAVRPVEGGPLGLIEALRHALGPGGTRVMPSWTGNDDEPFDEWLRTRGLQAEGRVGHAHARLARSRDIVAAALEHLARDPLLFLHPPGAGCDECDDARRSTEEP